MQHLELLEQLDGYKGQTKEVQERDFKNECLAEIKSLAPHIDGVGNLATKTIQKGNDRVFISAGFKEWKTTIFIRTINQVDGTSQSETWEHTDGKNPIYSLVQYKKWEGVEDWKTIYDRLEIKSKKWQSDFYKTSLNLLQATALEESDKK